MPWNLYFPDSMFILWTFLFQHIIPMTCRLILHLYQHVLMDSTFNNSIYMSIHPYISKLHSVLAIGPKYTLHLKPFYHSILYKILGCYTLALISGCYSSTNSTMNVYVKVGRWGSGGGGGALVRVQPGDMYFQLASSFFLCAISACTIYASILVYWKWIRKDIFLVLKVDKDGSDVRETNWYGGK